MGGRRGSLLSPAVDAHAEASLRDQVQQRQSEPPHPLHTRCSVFSSHWGVENSHICCGKLCNRPKGKKKKGEQPPDC